MPLYHFNLHDGHSYRDQQGTELPGLDAARTEAVRFAGQMFKDNPATVLSDEDWSMDVTDAAGLILFRLMFVIHSAPACIRL